MSLVLNIGGEKYFLDFVNIEKLLASGNSFKGGMIKETKTEKIYDENDKCISTKISTNEYHKSKEVDGFRYETIRNMIEILLDTNDTEDISNKAVLEGLPISFKLAFNTLIEYGILNITD